MSPSPEPRIKTLIGPTFVLWQFDQRANLLKGRKENHDLGFIH